MPDFTVSGAEGFQRLGKALKQAGELELRKEMTKGLQQAVKPLTPLTRAAALERLPKRGGLAKQVAKAPQRVQVRTGKNPGVRLVVGKRAGVRSTNRGIIRHPVFGNRENWVSQEVDGGWFDETVKKNKHVVKPAMDKAVQDVVDKIVRGARGR